MATFSKKIASEFFEAILSGKKKYELRLNDFDITEGDTLILVEHDSERNPTGRTLEKKVTYVGRFKPDELYWSIEEINDKGLQIISLE